MDLAALEFTAEKAVGFGVFGEEDETAGFAIKPVHDEGLASQMPGNLGAERLFGNAPAGDHGLADGLGDRDQTVVLVKNVQFRYFQG